MIQIHLGEDYNVDSNYKSWIELFTDALFLSPDQKVKEYSCVLIIKILKII